MPGECTKHGPWDGTQTRCPACRSDEYQRRMARPGNREKVRQQSRESAARNPERIKQYMKDRYYADHESTKVKQAAYMRERHQKNRAEVLDAYGGKCACCGESEPAFLCMDHIDGGGNAHRKEQTGNRRGSATTIYYWLKRNGYPEGFQILCANCNMAKERPQGCPHQRRA